MGGNPPDLVEPPRGCRFHPRCPHVMDICRRQEPPFAPPRGTARFQGLDSPAAAATGAPTSTSPAGVEPPADRCVAC